MRYNYLRSIVKIAVYYFLFFLSLNLFSASLKVEEGKGFVNVKISLTENEIELLSKGIKTDGFDYFLNVNEPALTFYPFYLALPPKPEVNFSYNEKSEVRNEKIPLLSEDGTLIYNDYELTEEWFPSKVARVLKSGFIRQVPFKIIHFYPIQISKNGIKINKEIEININYDCSSCSQIKEESIFSNIYNSIFLNNWKDKGTNLEKNLKSIWSIPSSPYTIYKIPIERDGIYALNYDFLDLNTDWVLSSIDPRKIHLYNLGQEIPIYITGESDGQFNTNDVLYFYGEYYKDENLNGFWQKGDFTDKNIYWLIIEDTQGLRMATDDVSPINNYTQIQNYEYTKKFEENIIESAFVPEQDSDHWMWKYARWYSYDRNPIQHHSIFLPGVSSNSSFNCTLTYNLRGISHRSQNPDHHLKIKINGNLVDEIYFDDYYFFEKTVNFPQSYLGGAGDQTIDLSVEVQDPAEIGIDGDGIQTNWFEISYSRDYISYNNELFFNITSGNWKTIISNFNSNNIILLNINNSKNPRFCLNAEIEEIQSGNFALKFEDSISALNNYISMVPLTPTELIAYQQANLLNENPNYLVIAPKSWTSSSVLSDYLNFRQSQGLTTKLVSVEDIYDQFNFGIFSPFPIKTYLQNLYNKSNPPELTYVLLIGDADYDYKDYGGDGNLNFIPTLMKANPGHSDSTYNPYAYYSFENYFGTFLGEDNIPEILIGRIPAKSQGEMETVLTKIKNYETNLPNKNYLKNFFHIADCRDGYWFKLAQNTNSSYLQTPFSLENMYLTDPPYNQNPGTCNSNYIDIDQDDNGIKDTIDKFNLGKGIVSFIGHGSFTLWSDFIVLKSPEDMEFLTNSNFPSVVLNSNCYTGSFYHSFYANSILEDLLLRNTGAVSAFGSGTFMSLYQINIPIEPVYKSFFGYEKERNLGILYYQAFLALETLGVDRLTQGFVALGDPKTNYPVPTPSPPRSFNLQYTACREITLTWQPPDENDKYLYNIYRSTELNGTYTNIFSNYDMLSYIDVDLVYGNTYYYFITAIDENGFEGKRTDIKSIYANPCPPNPPTNFQCTDSTLGGRINFTWDPSSEPEVNNFRIYYGYSTKNYAYFKDTGNVTSYQIGGLSDGTQIFSAISAWNSFNLESEKSNEVSCTPTHTNAYKPPEMVYPLTLTKNGTNCLLHFNLPTQNIWGDSINSSNLSLCTIYRSTNPNFSPNRSSSSPDKIGTLLPSSCNANQCLFEDTSSPSNAFYYVTCQTPNNEESSISKAPPTYPTNLNYKKIKGKYYINWDPVLTDINGNPINISFYEIYRGTTENFLPDVKDKTNRVGTSTINSYTDTPPDSQTYYYKVLAFDQKGNNGPY